RDSASKTTSPGGTAMRHNLRLGPIGQISRHVGDLDRAITFYRDVLGLPHLYAFGNLAFFDCAGLLRRPRRAPTRPHGPHPRSRAVAGSPRLRYPAEGLPMSDDALQATIIIDGARDVDGGELDDLTGSLRLRLLELDVDVVAPVRRDDVPDGAKTALPAV